MLSWFKRKKPMDYEDLGNILPLEQMLLLKWPFPLKNNDKMIWAIRLTDFDMDYIRTDAMLDAMYGFFRYDSQISLRLLFHFTSLPDHFFEYSFFMNTTETEQDELKMFCNSEYIYVVFVGASTFRHIEIPARSFLRSLAIAVKELRYKHPSQIPVNFKYRIFELDSPAHTPKELWEMIEAHATLADM